MKAFLKKFLPEDQIAAIEAKYIEANPGSTGLPEYVGKKRLDEVLGQKRQLDETVANLNTQLTEARKGGQAAIDSAVASALKTQKEAYESQIAGLKKDHEIESALMAAGAKNIVAVRALIDTTKPIADEIKRVQASDAYLFGPVVPAGTGKQGEDTNKDQVTDAQMEAMRHAVGI